MNKEPRDAFRGIVDDNWGDGTIDSFDNGVMPARLVVEKGEHGYDTNREIMRAIMLQCGPLETGEAFDVGDFMGTNDQRELGN